MSKLKTRMAIIALVLAIFSFLSLSFIDISIIKSALGIEEKVVSTVKISKTVPLNAGELAPEQNTDEIVNKKQFEEDLIVRNDIEKKRIGERLNSQAGAIYVPEKMIEFGAQREEENSASGCYSCPGMSDEELSARIKKALSELGTIPTEKEDIILQAVLLDDGQLAYIDDRPLYLDDNSNFINPIDSAPLIIDGKLLTKDLLESSPEIILTSKDGTDFYSNIGQKLDKRLLDEKDLNNLQHNGRKTYIDDNNMLRYVDTNDPVYDENNEPVFYFKDKGFVTAEGKPSKLGNSLKTKNNEIVLADGQVLSLPSIGKITDKDLNTLKYNGKDVYLDDNNMLRFVGSDEAVLDENNQPIFYKEGIGFINADGALSSINENLTNGEGYTVTPKGEVLLRSTLNTQAMSGDQAKIVALRNAKISKMENANDESNSSNDQGHTTLGNFYINRNNRLLSFDKEPLLFSKSAAILDEKLAIKNTSIKWSKDVNGFESTPIKPVFFIALQTKRVFSFDGTEISKEENNLIVRDGFLQTKDGGSIFFNTNKVMVNKEKELSANGIKITNLTNKQIFFDENQGASVTSDLPDSVDGILVNENRVAIDRLGHEIHKNSKLFNLLDGYNSIKFLTNSLVLRDNKPIYDLTGNRIIITKIELDQGRALGISNSQGVSVQDLTVKSVDGLLALHKNNKPYDPINVFVSDETGNKIPLVKLNIELDLLGTGLYVSEKNYVFSDPEALHVVLSNQMEPVKFDGRLIVDSKGKYLPILQTTKNPFDDSLLNIDGGILMDKETRMPLTDPSNGKFRVISKSDIDRVVSNATLMPNIRNTPDRALDSLLGVSESSSGRLYLRNKVMTSALESILMSDKSGNVSSTYAFDSPKLENPVLVPSEYRDYYRVDGGLLADQDGAIKQTDFYVMNGRFIREINGEEKAVTLIPQMKLLSFDGVLVSNGKIINFDLLSPSFTKDKLNVVGNLLADDEGNLLLKNKSTIELMKDGSLVDVATKKPIQGAQGNAFLDKNIGIVNKNGQANNILLRTLDGDIINEKGRKSILKNLTRRPNIDKFFFDEHDNVYTADRKPLQVNEQQVKIDEEDSLYVGTTPLTRDEKLIVLTDQGLVTPTGDSTGLIFTPEGAILEDNLEPTGDLFNDVLNFAKSPLDILKGGVEEKSINNPPVNVENRSQSNWDPKSSVTKEDTNQSSESDNSQSKNKRKIGRLDEPQVVWLTEAEMNNLSGFDLDTMNQNINNLSAIVNSNFSSTARQIQNRSGNSANSSPNKLGSSNGGSPTNFNKSTSDFISGIESVGEDVEDTNQPKKENQFRYARVETIPEDAISVFRKGDRHNARVIVPFSTSSVGGSAKYNPMIEITSGSLRGATMEGTVVLTSNDIVLMFENDLVLRDGTRVQTTGPFGISIDPNTGFAGTGAEVDNHFFEKFFKLAPFVIFSKAGEWIELVNTQVSTTTGITGQNSNTIAEMPSADEFALLLAGETAKISKDIIQSDLDALTRSIKLMEGKEIEVVITQDIFARESDLYPN
ncbi:hypothetical protein [Marinomonas sp. 2405UD68-3]|uniref:hypothetical protein n=1 Tax=Marinomonas sp. 2405UD68-3 TaxID=3391835 RepID=UPI0039C9CB80